MQASLPNSSRDVQVAQGPDSDHTIVKIMMMMMMVVALMLVILLLMTMNLIMMMMQMSRWLKVNSNHTIINNSNSMTKCS